MVEYFEYIFGELHKMRHRPIYDKATLFVSLYHINFHDEFLMGEHDLCDIIKDLGTMWYMGDSIDLSIIFL